MTADTLPFQSFAFTLVGNKRPRTSFRLSVADEGMYDLVVQKGSAANPSKQVKRKVPVEVAERLRDALQEIGVFGWESHYGDGAAPGSRKWSLSIVFQEGVFSLESKGGSDAPAGFDQLLEELYRMDFPRPASGSKSGEAGMRIGSAVNSLGLGGMGSIGGMSAADMSAFASLGSGLAGNDFSRLSEVLGGDMQEMLAEMQRNPAAVQQRMTEEFRHMSPEEQRQLIDMLVASGMGSRDYWERFFRS